VIAAAPRTLELAAAAGVEDYQAAIPRDAVVIAVARSLLDRGRWEAALELAARGRREWFGEVPLALAIEALVRARRGEPGATALVEQAFAGAARAEVAWLGGDHQAVLAEVVAVRTRPVHEVRASVRRVGALGRALRRADRPAAEHAGAVVARAGGGLARRDPGLAGAGRAV
jgi:hypothetical protein